MPWFRLPKRIISDHDPRFTSAFAQEMCKVLGVQQNLSTAFHPRMDGQTECMNAWLEQYLRPWTASQPTSWSKILPIAEFAHNLWRHDIMQKSPHKLLFGMKLQVILKHLKSPMPAAETCLKLLDKVRQMAQKLLAHVQNRKDDRKTTEMKVGDQVCYVLGPTFSSPSNFPTSWAAYPSFPMVFCPYLDDLPIT